MTYNKAIANKLSSCSFVTAASLKNRNVGTRTSRGSRLLAIVGAIFLATTLSDMRTPFEWSR
jgi:hypothetical protein